MRTHLELKQSEKNQKFESTFEDCSQSKEKHALTMAQTN